MPAQAMVGERKSGARPLSDVATPALLLDRQRLTANIGRLHEKVDALGVTLRPHLKTCKSVEIAQLVLRGPGRPAAVSTLAEAEVFARAGVTDMIYAVGLAPDKLPRVVQLRRQGVDLAVLVDSVAQASAVAAAVASEGLSIPVFIEVDSDGQRAGLEPADPRIVEIAHVLPGCSLRGILTHCGGSYGATSPNALQAAAEQEREAAERAAATLTAAGFRPKVVSVGSSPTAFSATSAAGITEIRAGVFVFFDLCMAGLGVCSVSDIAISVLTTVIGTQREKGWLVVDAGWSALSSDRSTAAQPVDQGYGLVCDLAGRPLGDIIVTKVSQEHGIVSPRPGSSQRCPDLSIGSRVRILPNHACATAGQFDRYEVLAGDGRGIEDRWSRIRGW